MLTADSDTPPIQKPNVTQDFAFFYEGLNNGELLVQKCNSCGKRRYPPGPMCGACQSLEWTTEALGATGTVHSFVVHHAPAYPEYPSPHVVVLVDMAPNVRVIGALAGCAPEAAAIGMLVRTEFVRHGENFTLHRFVPAEAA
jgi:uncharacterized protein